MASAESVSRDFSSTARVSTAGSTWDVCAGDGGSEDRIGPIWVSAKSSGTVTDGPSGLASARASTGCGTVTDGPSALASARASTGCGTVTDGPSALASAAASTGCGTVTDGPSAWLQLWLQSVLAR